jgi:hypothetical protein
MGQQVLFLAGFQPFAYMLFAYAAVARYITMAPNLRRFQYTLILPELLTRIPAALSSYSTSSLVC